MQAEDVFFTLIGPLGPEDDFFEYRDYWEKTIREMNLETLIAGIRDVKTKYARWPESVQAVGIEYMDTHPEHEQIVHQVLTEVGLDPDVEDEA